MRNLLAAGLIFLGGCVATGTQEECWHPKTEHEMRMLIGQTLLMAMEQYDTYLQMLEDQKSKAPLKGLNSGPDRI